MSSEWEKALKKGQCNKKSSPSTDSKCKDNGTEGDCNIKPGCFWYNKQCKPVKLSSIDQPLEGAVSIVEGRKAVKIGSGHLSISGHVPWPDVKVSDAALTTVDTIVQKYIGETVNSQIEHIECGVNHYDIKPLAGKFSKELEGMDYSPFIKKLTTELDSVDLSPIITKVTKDLEKVDYSPIIKKVVDGVKASDVTGVVKRYINLLRNTKNAVINGLSTVVMVGVTALVLIYGILIYLAMSRNFMVAVIIIIVLTVGGVGAGYVISNNVRTTLETVYCTNMNAKVVDGCCHVANKEKPECMGLDRPDLEDEATDFLEGQVDYLEDKVKGLKDKY